MGYIKMLICNLFETKKTISSSKNTYFHVDRQKKEEKHCKCNLYSLNLKQTLSMIRFILHSILILVVTQLSNVAMGLIMTESQHTAVTYQLAQLHDSINKGQSLDFQNQYPSPLIRTSLVSMTRSELPCRVRVMLDGVYKQANESLTINKEADHAGIHDVFISHPKRYFHELCLLII